MTKAEKIMKELDERDARDAAKRAATPPPTPATPPRAPSKHDGMSKDRQSMLLANIIPDLQQPRKDFDEREMADLAESIKTHGVIQPIKLRWLQDVGKWQIVVGERRYRAALSAGLTEIPFREEDADTRDKLDEIQWIENWHRAPLKASEKAAQLGGYMVRRGWTQKQVAQRMKMSEQTVSNILALPELPTQILNLVDAAVIPVDVGVGLTKIKDPIEQLRIAEKIVNEGMNRAQALAEVNAQKPSKKRKGSKAPKTITRKATNGIAVTVGRKEAMTAEEICDALRETIEHFGQEGRRAA